MSLDSNILLSNLSLPLKKVMLTIYGIKKDLNISFLFFTEIVLSFKLLNLNIQTY